MKKIYQRGDYVRHPNLMINGGRPMRVEKIDEIRKEVWCTHFGSNMQEYADWFKISDLL